MTNEIKEILDYLKDENIYIEEYDYCYKHLSLEESKLLLHYIINLQQRIDKTIEYIKDNVAVYAFNNKELPHWEFNDNNMQDLLNILRGVE